MSESSSIVDEEGAFPSALGTLMSSPSGGHFRHERAEEKQGPVPRPRANINQVLEVATNEPDPELETVARPATESLFHIQRVAEGMFDLSRGKNREDRAPENHFNRYAASVGLINGRKPDAFDVAAKVFGFQQSSVENQRDNALSMLTSRLSRAVGNKLDNLVAVEDGTLVLEAFRGELLSNYTRWCSYLGVHPISLASLFEPPGGHRALECSWAAEAALTLLIWGEAGNLRFCPEFLCFLFHKMAATYKAIVDGRAEDKDNPPYLDKIICPAYKLLKDQLEGIGHGVIDHSRVCNYDDFNEIFWQESCLNLEVETMFEANHLKKRFRKSFVERQSWLVPIFAFWRVYTLHFVGLHFMIVGARCQESIGDDPCSYRDWGTSMITLYVCSFIKDMWDVNQTLYVAVGHRGSFSQLFLNILRASIKAVIVLLLVILYLASDFTLFPVTAAIFLFLAIAGEVIMLTELWWGIASYGKWGESTDRSCSGGGFASCLPGRIRQLSWAVIGSLCGINAVNLYTQIHSLPPVTKRVRYILFWAIVLGTKILFSYFVVIKEMTVATNTLYNLGVPTTFNFGFFGTWEDDHNIIYIVALWIGNGLIFFLDLQIWFVVWVNIAAAVEGVRRRVGEFNGSDQVVRMFSRMHKAFFSYLKREMKDSTLHTRFAHVWNEIVDAMREEDILSNKERSQLRYFLINLRLPKANMESIVETYSVETTEGEWGPLFTLLPEFLMSGAVQRAVQSAQEFGKKVQDVLSDINREEDLVKQQERTHATRVMGSSVNDRKLKLDNLRNNLANEQFHYLKEHSNDEVTSEMIRQLSASVFVLIDALCRNEALSRSMWNLHRALFASDVNQPGQGIGKKEGWGEAFNVFGEPKDKPPAKLVAGFSRNALLFNVQNFPGFISATIDLVKTLDAHRTGSDWSKSVGTKLDKMVGALVSLLDTKTGDVHSSNGVRTFVYLLKDVRQNLEDWKKSFSRSDKTAHGARPFKNTAKEFISRTLVFLVSPANSQPGMIKSAEARRRIIFFVNSLFVEQPKPAKALRMPSLTTLTPYYNEDVVLSLESLRAETQDGVTVLEYLRSIYPDEFDNFVERLRSEVTNRNFRYRNVDVVGKMLEVVLDTEEVDSTTPRSGVLERAEKAVIDNIKNKMADDGGEAGEGKEIESAVKDLDLGRSMLDLQLWASHRGQTLSRTIRGIMYYQQAVRLLATVENIEEFQPKETGYMFGSSDKPSGEQAFVRIASEAMRTAIPGQTESEGTNRKFWQPWRTGGVTSRNSSVEGEKPPSFHPTFQSVLRNNQEGDFEARLDENLAELEEGVPSHTGARSGNRRPRTPVHPAAERANAHSLQGSKFKAAVKRAMEAVKREKEAAARRGRQSQRDIQNQESDHKGFIQVQDPALDKSCVEYGLTAELAETKFRYVVSCQVFGKMQNSKKADDKEKARHIKMLASKYPGLRISYVDEKDGLFFSVLSKSSDTGDDMEEEYRIQLPGHILVGEGKPNNQNHAIIFTRGEAVQAIDMNQDASLEDAIKIRQVMEEFNFAHEGTGRGRNIGRIVGFREHVFTHDVSAVANFFSLQELNFVSATQRALDNPLHIRFHYGHPDLFDRISAMTMGGVSKASKGIHLSEDIFAGFNYVLRGGESTQADYIQVSKGRDTGVSQVTGFTAKISMGNGMQARSRDVYRLATQLDLFRLLSFHYSSVGGFMNQVLLMTAVFLYMYAKLFIAFDPAFSTSADETVLEIISTQFLFQLGFLLILPIPLLLAVEQGLQRAISTLVNIILRLAPFFFIFSAGTNAYYVNSAVMTGQAKYQATGRGFVIAHEDFVQLFPLYLQSHFNPAFELLVVLIVYASFSTSGYLLETFSVYLLCIGLLWTPMIFNPNGLDFSYASQDFSGWLQWMNSPVDDPKKSWFSWYTKVVEESRSQLPLNIKIQIVIRRSRLLILVYGFLTSIGEDYEGGVDGDVWPGSALVGGIMLIVVILLMCESWFRGKCCQARALNSGVHRARFARLWKLFLFVGLLVAVIILTAIDWLESARQFIFYILSFIILIYYTANILVLFSEDAMRNVTLARMAFWSVHFLTGLVIMVPVLLVSFLPLFVDLQTRMLFNEDFSERFQIAKIFARHRKRRVLKKDA